MNPMPTDPWDLELPEYLLDVSVSPGDLHPHYADVDPRSFDRDFYRDDRHITGAALPLHVYLASPAPIIEMRFVDPDAAPFLVYMIRTGYVPAWRRSTDVQ